MSNQQQKSDDRYIHYHESITCLNRSWRTLCELEELDLRNSVWAAAYRMCIVEYCKPFKISRSKIHRYKLDVPAIENEYLILHHQVIALRDQVIAHSDLTILDGSVSYGNSPVPLLLLNIVDQFPEVSKLRKLVELVLDQLYSEEKSYYLETEKSE